MQMAGSTSHCGVTWCDHCESSAHRYVEGTCPRQAGRLGRLMRRLRQPPDPEELTERCKLWATSNPAGDSTSVFRLSALQGKWKSYLKKMGWIGASMPEMTQRYLRKAC